MKRSAVLLGLMLLAVISCYRAGQNEVQKLQANWQRYVHQKDSLFKHAEWSPLLPEDRAHFKGLNYFQYNSGWRFELPLHLYPNPQQMIIKGSRPGDERPALRYGYFQFVKNGVPVKLDVIKILGQAPGESDHLFLGFWDATSGEETYAGGRYIDLEQKEANIFVVDFNFAYNPYCAYSDRYSCAVPPFSNQIPLAVRAGEKIFKEHH